MPKAKVTDINMYYEVYGKGEPLVFIAGLGADHTRWLNIAEKLQDQYQIILVNNRGAGQTDAPAGPYSIEQMAADTAALCKHLNIDNALFVGNSMGGYIVQMLAYQYPELVKAAVISNSSLTAEVSFNAFLNAYTHLLKTNADFSALVMAVSTWVYSYQYLNQPGVLDNLITMTLANPGITLPAYEAQQAALRNFNSSEWAKHIKVPTLVIGADEDIIFLPKYTKAIADAIPHAAYYCFEKCGHLPHVEYPEKFVELIREFANKHE